MTNIDPGGFLVLLSVVPAVVAGVVSIGVARLVAWAGYGAYETTVLAVLAVLVAGWILAAFAFTTGMLAVLPVLLSAVGAFAVTRDVTATSYGWVIGVALLFFAFAVLSALGVYQGVDRAGRPRGLLSRHFRVFYAGGLFASGAVAGAAVEAVRDRL